MQRISVSRYLRNNLPVYFLRLRKLAALMKSDRLPEGGRHLGRRRISCTRRSRRMFRPPLHHEASRARIRPRLHIHPGALCRSTGSDRATAETVPDTRNSLPPSRLHHTRPDASLLRIMGAAGTITRLQTLSQENPLQTEPVGKG